MCLFDKKDFPVFHDILYYYSLPCDLDTKVPYLNSFIVDTLLKPNKKEYSNISNNLLNTISHKLYKKEKPFVISERYNKHISYFITMPTFYILYCKVRDINLNTNTLRKIKAEASLNGINLMKFSFKQSNEIHPKYRYFLNSINTGLKIFGNNPSISFCKIYIK